MNTLLTRIRTAIYRATVVANARYRSDVLNLQAMGLTYSTLLSLVPFLAVMFSVLKAFGAQNVLEPFLLQLLQPLGNAAAEVTSSIINFVENIRVGILGAAGTAMLFYTVVTLVAKIEDAIDTTRGGVEAHVVAVQVVVEEGLWPRRRENLLELG